MTVPRRALIYAAIWVGVVLVCSTLVWAVISRAGEGVTSGEAPERSASTSSPRVTGTPSTAPTISPSASPTTGPTTAPTGAPTSPGGTSTPPAAVERTWSGVGGVVVVVCRGTAAGLNSATPDDGFTVEVDDTGPGRVEVEFEGQGDSDARTRVRAECVGGEPLFDVDTD